MTASGRVKKVMSMVTQREVLDEEAVEYVKVVERFCAERIAPIASEIDRRDEWFPDVLKECAAMGLQGVMVADDRTIDPARIFLAEATSEVLASYSPSVAIAIGAARLHTVMLATHASPEVRDRWLDPVINAEAFGSMGISEPEAGSDIRNARTVARRDGEGWILDGSKAWTTLSPISSFTVVLAKLGSADRGAEFGMFLVERGMPGMSYGENDSLVGYRGVPMANVYFDGIAIPPEFVLAESDGFKRILAGLNFARIEAASLGVGILRGCLRHVSSYARSRVTFGSVIANHQAIQLRAGDMAMKLEAARALQLAAARSYATGHVDHDLCAMSKVFASDAAMDAATRAVSVFGGMGVSEDYEIERYMRDAKATQIFDGTSDVLTLQIGRSALSREDW